MEYILHLMFTNILRYTKATENCVLLHAQLQQPWAHCDQLHEHHNAHWREHCAVLSTPHTVCRCIALMRTPSHVAQVSSVCHSISSMHAHLCLVAWVLSSSSCLSTLFSSPSSTSSWILPWCLTRIPWKIPCATPASGGWSAWTLSHPTQKAKRSRSGISRNRSSIMPDNYVVSSSLNQMMKKLNTPWKTLVDSWKFRCQQQCLLRHQQIAAVKPAAILGSTRPNMLVLSMPTNPWAHDWKVCRTGITKITSLQME